MRSITCLLLCLSALPGAELSFVPNEVLLYTYSLRQVVEQHLAGETLKHESLVEQELALRVLSPTTLRATILRIRAEHQGPGSQHRIDSSNNSGSDDPLLGHLLLLNGRSLDLNWDPVLQQVSQVTGGSALVAALANNALGHSDTRAQAAERAYGDAALTQLWRGLLAVPRDSSEELPLPAPLTGAMLRSWEGSQYRLSLAQPGSLSITLESDPLPLEARLSQCSGQGQVTIREGCVQNLEGTLRYQLDWLALTQPVTQVHELTWKLSLRSRAPLHEAAPEPSARDERR